ADVQQSAGPAQPGRQQSCPPLAPDSITTTQVPTRAGSIPLTAADNAHKRKRSIDFLDPSKKLKTAPTPSTPAGNTPGPSTGNTPIPQPPAIRPSPPVKRSPQPTPDLPQAPIPQAPLPSSSTPPPQTNILVDKIDTRWSRGDNYQNCCCDDDEEPGQIKISMVAYDLVTDYLTRLSTDYCGVHTNGPRDGKLTSF